MSHFSGLLWSLRIGVKLTQSRNVSQTYISVFRSLATWYNEAFFIIISNFILRITIDKMESYPLIPGFY